MFQGGLSAQTYVHIEIEDVNDNPPVFSPEEYTVSISSHAPPGTELGNVMATDRDVGRFGRISYYIHPGDVSDLFTLDKQTGKDIWLIYFYDLNTYEVNTEGSFLL